MLLKALVVDDEKVICEGLIAFIDWIRYGFCIPDTADNGCSALSLMEKREYNLVLTDIRMPGIDGLELARLIRGKNLSCDIVIMSGYKDFEYARTALKYGVTKYLLKPVEEDELTETLITIRKKFEELHKRLAKDKQMIELTWKTLLQDLANNKTDDVKEYLTSNIVFERNNLYTLFLLKNVFQEKSSMMEYLSGLCPSGQLIVFEYDPITIGLLYVTPELDSSYDTFVNELKLITGDPEKNHILIATSPVYGTENLIQAFNSASKVLESSFYCTDSRVLFCNDNENTPISLAVTFVWDQEIIFDKILKGDIAGTMAEISNLICALRTNKPTVKLCLDAVSSLISRLSHIVSSTGDNSIDAIGQDPDTVINCLSDINKLEKTMIDVCTAVIDYINKKKNKKNQNYLERIKKYIDENHQSPITVKDLASQFYMNPSYLGRKFKEYTGIGINEFLNNCRIEHAKRLLSMDRNKASEIYLQIGYFDIDTYYAQFKKITGMNPTQYRMLYFMK